MTKQPPIDLRSDTVTKPDKQMRAAMAAAEVGDDVLDGDPTMHELEVRIADLLGAEAALWVPSGSMGNLIALMLHIERGSRFLAPEHAHVLDSELGTAAWLAGGMPQPLPWELGPGRISPSAVLAAASQPSPYHALRTTLLCLENTHNAAGGTILPPDEHAQLVAVAKDKKLKVHLDGARLWHAAVALGLPPAALAVGVDSVQVCLSKGLGAPVGSLLAGAADFIAEARRVRKMLGGGVRQGGVLAAAGLVALDRQERLADDHANATALAEGLLELGWDAQQPETNIVLAAVADVGVSIDRLGQVGILTTPMAGRVRFVLHSDIRRRDVTETLRRIQQAAKNSAKGH